MFITFAETSQNRALKSLTRWPRTAKFASSHIVHVYRRIALTLWQLQRSSTCVYSNDVESSHCNHPVYYDRIDQVRITDHSQRTNSKFGAFRQGILYGDILDTLGSLAENFA